MARIINGNLLDIRNGIIVHQVNCQNKIGAGLSGQIIKRYPMVQKAYHDFFNIHPDSREMLGSHNMVQVDANLFVINLYTQLHYGNGQRNKACYTDIPLLVSGLKKICKFAKEKSLDVYIPYAIGCGLAGGSWEEVYGQIRDLNLTIVKRE